MMETCTTTRRQSFWQKQGQRYYSCAAVIFALFLCIVWRHSRWNVRPTERTLFLITHSATDEEYTDNLRFLIKHGMGGEDESLREYVIIVQQVTSSNDLEKQQWLSLPRLPNNARYVQHKNVCFDWGTFGWALFNLNLDISKYKYYMFMNTSVRGPYLPTYWERSRHWSQLYISRITKQVKLVGSTISCEGAHEFGGVSGRGRHNPHVQSYVVATDQITGTQVLMSNLETAGGLLYLCPTVCTAGLQVLLEDKHVFECHRDISDAVFYAEIGSSLAIFRAGYTIDSLMLRYQGVDWTDSENWQCNANLNPYADFAYDGLLLNPMEVVFVKVKRFQQEANWGSARLADAYSRWMEQEKAPGAVNSNQMVGNRLSLRLGRVIEMLLRGPACFDFHSYIKASPDLESWSPEQLWLHFVLEDQFSGRKFWFLCDNPLKNDTLAADVVRWHYEQTRQFSYGTKGL